MQPPTSEASQPAPRWGLLGVGNIANDFSTGLLNNNSQIAAVAARDFHRAEAFRKKVGALRSYGSYEELIGDPDVDVVYVGTIHTMHLVHTRMALEAGKHVVCEKPLGINEAQTKELVELARSRGRFLMEAMWTRFFPAVRRLREALAKEEVGCAKYITGDFGFVAPKDVSRYWDPAQAGGAMLDIGCYLVQAAVMVFGSTMPNQIACTGQVSDTGVDIDGALALTWQGKGSASLLTTLAANTPEELLVICSKGNCRLPGPAHCPTSLIISHEEGRGNFDEERFDFPLPPCPEGFTVNYPHSEGMLFQVQAVEGCLKAGQLECPEYTLDESVTVAKIMDSYRKQLGVVYPCDTR